MSRLVALRRECCVASRKISILRELHATRPFVPFTLSLADGRMLHVPHHEFLSLSPSGRVAFLFTDREDRFTLIDLLMVTSADLNPARRRKSKRA